MTMVSLLSKMEEWWLPTMSMDTMGSSVYSSTPASWPSAASFIAALISSMVTLALQLDRQVDHGAVGRGNARGEAVELACQLGEDQGHGASGTPVVVGDHGHGCGAGAAQVLMRQVQDLLVVRCRSGWCSCSRALMPNFS